MGWPKEAFLHLRQIAKPDSRPQSGGNLLYAKADNRLYILDSDGTEHAAGASAGFVPGVTAESHGAIGDGVADDTAEIQAAINAAAAANLGNVLLGPGKTYLISSTLNMASGVNLTSLGTTIKWAGGETMATLSAATGWSSDYMVKFDNVNSAGISGIVLSGNVSAGNQVLVGGVKIVNGCDWITVESCSFGTFSVGAVYVDGRACKIANNGMQNFTDYQTLSADQACFYITGTDHWIENNQVNAGMALNATVDANLYRCAVKVESQASWFIGGNGEFSECAWKITGLNNYFIGIRGDTNAGVGMVLGSAAANNHFTDTIFQSCCVSADDTLDLITVGSQAYANHFQGIQVGFDYTASGNRPRYMIQDNNVFGSNGHNNEISQCKFSGLIYSDTYFSRDVYGSSSGSRPSFKGDSAGVATIRPPSRQAAGRIFYDTTDNRPTFSDGNRWRDASGNPLGNLLDAISALATDGTIQWDPYDAGGGATSTLTREKGLLHTSWARASLFGVAATTAGVTAGQATALLKNAKVITAGIAAGNSYKAQVECKGATGRSGNTVTVSVLWYNAAHAFLNTTTTSINATAITNNSTSLLLSTSFTAPANAAECLIAVAFNCTGLTAGDKFYFTNGGLIPGTTATGVQEP